MPICDYISEEAEEPKRICPRATISTLELIDDYIRNLANAKKTVVSGILEYIQNIFHNLISKYSRLSVMSFNYLEMKGARLAKVRSLR